MSHDIRTPINGIMGMLTILEKSGNDGERAKDCVSDKEPPKPRPSAGFFLSLVPAAKIVRLKNNLRLMNCGYKTFGKK